MIRYPVLMDDGGRALAEMPAKEMLLLLGGVLALTLGPTFFVLSLAMEGLGLPGVAAALVDVVLGFLLLLSVGVMRRSRPNGVLLGLISSVLLIAMGGVAGVIGGLFGLVGSIIAFVTSYEGLLR